MTQPLKNCRVCGRSAAYLCRSRCKRCDCYFRRTGTERPTDLKLQLAHETNFCRACQQIKAISEFDRDCRRPRGVRDICRECSRAHRVANRLASPTEKCCAVCQQTKPITDFLRDVNVKGGFRARCKACARQDQAILRLKNRDRIRAQQTRHARRIKMQAIVAYGNGSTGCACCGETRLEFLAVDHSNGGGNKHRREAQIGSGSNFYHWLKKNGYPPGFRILCHNCNASFGHYGYCPHQRERGETGMEETLKSL